MVGTIEKRKRQNLQNHSRTTGNFQKLRTLWIFFWNFNWELQNSKILRLVDSCSYIDPLDPHSLQFRVSKRLYNPNNVFFYVWLNKFVNHFPRFWFTEVFKSLLFLFFHYLFLASTPPEIVRVYWNRHTGWNLNRKNIWAEYRSLKIIIL